MYKNVYNVKNYGFCENSAISFKTVSNGSLLFSFDRHINLNFLILYQYTYHRIIRLISINKLIILYL
jgi:hypothetical protein